MRDTGVFVHLGVGVGRVTSLFIAHLLVSRRWMTQRHSRQEFLLEILRNALDSVLCNVFFLKYSARLYVFQEQGGCLT